MSVGRSGKYLYYVCENARTGKNGCKLRGYKSAKIIDTAVLEQLSQSFFTDEFISEIVQQAKEFLQWLDSQRKIHMQQAGLIELENRFGAAGPDFSQAPPT